MLVHNAQIRVVFFGMCLLWFPPVIINMFNHMDAVMMCCDGDSDLPCIVERDKVKFCDITQSPSVIIPPCEEESSLQSRLTRLAVAVIFLNPSCQLQ